jgi:hypothetical protein
MLPLIPRLFSTAPSNSERAGVTGDNYKIYGFAGLLAAANLFAIWQELDAHDDDSYKLKMERQLAWEQEEKAAAAKRS